MHKRKSKHAARGHVSSVTTNLANREIKSKRVDCVKLNYFVFCRRNLENVADGNFNKFGIIIDVKKDIVKKNFDFSLLKETLSVLVIQFDLD